MTFRPTAKSLRHAAAAAGLIVTSGVATLAALTGQAGATPVAPAAQSWHFSVHNDSADTTFNQLLGVNDHGVIAGYFGSGTPATTHPNKGYTLTVSRGRASYRNENFPGSQQTQVTGINDLGQTVGFYVDADGNTYGFLKSAGRYIRVANPAAPTNNQLLGINNRGYAVGVYTDGAGNTHGYVYNTRTRRFSPIHVNVPGIVSTQATGINDQGDISGFYTDGAGNQTAFFLSRNRQQFVDVTGSSMVQAFGVNDENQVVGQYVDAAKNTHGFIWSNGHVATVDEPAANGSTTVNGINNDGEIVGFFTDANGNTDGFTAQRSR